MPAVRGFGRGDIIAEVSVITPRSLSARERELFEELRAIETGQAAHAAARDAGSGACADAGGGAGSAAAGKGKGKDKKSKNAKRGFFGLFGQDDGGGAGAGADKAHDEMG